MQHQHQHQHQRHRSPGNGYRSRISPEYRYFNRRPGPTFQAPPPPIPIPIPIPPPPPPPRKFDIFVEAGRLAAQYLASQGLLPPDRLPSNLNRTSALARLGSAAAPPNSDSDADHNDFANPARTLNLKSPITRRLASSSSSSSTYRGYGAPARNYDYSRSASFHDRPSSRDFHADDRYSTLHPLGDDNAEHDFGLDSEEPLRPADDDYDSRNSSGKSGKPREDCSASSSVAETSVVDQKASTTEEDCPSSASPPDLRSTLTKVPTRTRSSKAPKIPKLDQAPPISEVEPDKEAPAPDSPAIAADDDDDDDADPQTSQGTEEERGEKRALGDGCETLEGAKRPRDWPSSSLVMDSGDYFEPHGVSEKKASSNNDDGGEELVEFSQEKQGFPCSFKICDLNLMEASEAHEHRHGGDLVAIYPALSEIKKEETPPVDVDLSISSSNASLGEAGRRPVESKEIEVIDLDNDSSPEDKDLAISDTKTETVYSELDGFPSHEQNTSNIPDVQDGYGLMISELLENDFPNCSSVPQHMDTVHNDIDLHNAEGTAIGDDDSIYMSLGEIPLTYLRPWEQQPPQEYEKPF